MIPKEKAEELVDRYNYNNKHYLMPDAKQCALIAVDEILNEYPSQCPKDSYERERHIFWQEVKEELLKM